MVIQITSGITLVWHCRWPSRATYDEISALYRSHLLLLHSLTDAVENGERSRGSKPCEVTGGLPRAQMSEFETHGQNDSRICPPNIEDVGSKVDFSVGEAREKASLHIKRCLICAGSLRSQPSAKPVGRRVG
jgi:hypothetical protein